MHEHDSLHEHSISLQQASLEQSYKESGVHQLYSGLIQNDLETTRQRTFDQLEAQKWNMSISSNNLDELKNDNRILKRNIKYCKVLIAKQEEKLQQKIK